MDENEEFHTVRGYQLIDHTKKSITSAMEDYLEMIYRNSVKDGYMRINYLSELLNVAPPSTTRMVQRLNKLGLVDYKKYGIINLTENGLAIGKFLLQRHHIIECFLKNLGVKESLLLETELIEHSITALTLQKLNDFNHFFILYPDIAEKFQQFSTHEISSSD